MKTFFSVCSLLAFLGTAVMAGSSILLDPPPNPYGWNNTPVTVTISGSGTIYWQVDGGPIHSAPSPVTFIVAEEGVHTVRYRDETEPSFKTAVIHLDFAPPRIFIGAPKSGEEYILNQPLLAEWSVWDGLSGVAQVWASAPSGSAVDTRFPGQQKFTVRAKDRAGNEAEAVSLYFVRGLIHAVLPSGFYLDRVLPPEETVKVGRYFLRARYKAGEEVIVAFVMKDYFGQTYSQAWPELNVVRVRFVEDVEEYPLRAWFRIPFDAEKGYYALSFSTRDYEPGYYDLWVFFGDGRFERIRFEVTPKD